MCDDDGDGRVNRSDNCSRDRQSGPVRHRPGRLRKSLRCRLRSERPRQRDRSQPPIARDRRAGTGQWRRHRHGLRRRREPRGLPRAPSAVPAARPPRPVRPGCAARGRFRVRCRARARPATTTATGSSIARTTARRARTHASATPTATDSATPATATSTRAERSTPLDLERYFEPDRRAGRDSGRGTDMNCDGAVDDIDLRDSSRRGSRHHRRATARVHRDSRAPASSRVPTAPLRSAIPTATGA